MIGFELVILVIFIILLGLAYKYVPLLTDKSIQGPMPFPVIGNLPHIEISHLGEYMSKFTIKYGRVCRVFLPKEMVITADPDVIRSMLMTDYENFDKNPIGQLIFRDLAGGLILAPHGEQWKVNRSLFQPAFKAANIENLYPIFIEKTDQFCSRLERAADTGQIVDFQSMFQKLLFDEIGLISFGVDFKTLTAEGESPFEAAFSYCFSHLTFRAFFPVPFWKWIRTASVREYEKHIGLLHGTIRHQIRVYLEQGVKEDDHSLLAYVIRRRKEMPEWLTEDEMVIQLMTFLFAGHETTASLLTWAAYYLSEYPQEKSKMIEEIECVVGNNEISPGILSKLTYMNAFLKETSRMRPSAAFLRRLVKEDRIIEWERTGGNRKLVTLKKGQSVIYSAYATHHHPDNWKDPETFMPDRFLVESEFSNNHPCALLTFGAGPRRCIGEKVGMAEAKIVLVKLLSKLDFTVQRGHKMVMETRGNMHAKYGLKMRVTHREV